MRPYNQGDNDPIFVHSGGWYAKMIQRQREMEFIFTILFTSFFFVASVVRNLVAPFKQTERVLSIGREINEYGEELEVIGVLDSELRKHIHVIGGTGRGKTTLLKNAFIQLAIWNRGIILIDPKGDLVDAAMQYIPQERMEDVVLLDPTDREFAVAFNIFGNVPPSQRSRLAGEVIAIFRKVTSQGSWGPRLEATLRNAVLALLEVPGTTLLDLYYFLLDEEFRNGLLPQVKDRFVSDFWRTTFTGFSGSQQTNIVGPILNKIEPLLSYPEARRILGQPNSTIDLRDIMDKGKILLVRIPQGVLGEDLSSIMGALVMTMVQMQLMHRASQPISQRRQVHLIMDEFQNFTNESIELLLSLARSFGLSVVCANQHNAQLTPEVVASLDNNCAVRIRCEMDGYNHLALMQILQDINQPELLIRPLRPPHPGSPECPQEIRALSRLKYGVPVTDVEEMLRLKWELHKGIITIPSRALAAKTRAPRPVATQTPPEVLDHYGF